MFVSRACNKEMCVTTGASQRRNSTRRKQIYHKRPRPSDVWQLPKQQMTMMTGAMMTLAMSCLQCKKRRLKNNVTLGWRNCGISCTVEIARKMPHRMRIVHNLPESVNDQCGQNSIFAGLLNLPMNQAVHGAPKKHSFSYWVKIIAPPFSAQERKTVQLQCWEDLLCWLKDIERHVALFHPEHAHDFSTKSENPLATWNIGSKHMAAECLLSSPFHFPLSGLKH